MTSLFILQLVCCVITAMLALQLAMASLQVRWKVWRYEISRWLLVASMLFFSVHYLLQMVHGFRAQGTDVGAAFNILFYTPVAFAITLSIINIESTSNKVRRYCLHSMMAYILHRNPTKTRRCHSSLLQSAGTIQTTPRHTFMEERTCARTLCSHSPSYQPQCPQSQRNTKTL